MELFQLLGTIAIDNAEANNSIEDTTEKAGSFGEKLKSGISTAAKWGTAIVAGAGTAAAGLTAFASKSASAADNVDKMSQKIGISRQAYQELDFICSQSGTSVDMLQSGMKSLTAAMDGVASGTASNVEQFERLGVSVMNSDGTFRSQEDVLFDTMSALQNMSDQTEKARLATELFGRSGTELMPLLNGAAGSIDEMKQQAADLGLVLSDDVIDSGVELTDTMDQMKRSFGSVVTKLGASLMPIVKKVCDAIINYMPKIQSMAEKLEPIFIQIFDGLLPPLMDLAEQIFPVLIDLVQQLLPPITDIIQQVMPIIVELLQMILPPLMEVVQQLLPVAVEIINSLLPILEAFLPVLQPIFELIVELLPPLIELINVILMPLIDLLVAFYQVYFPAVKKGIELIAKVITTVFNVAVMSIKDIIENVKISFDAVWDGIKAVWEGAAEFFSGIWEGIKSVFNSVTSFFSEIFSDAWESVKAVFNAGGQVFEGIKEGIAETFKEIVNFLIDGINVVVATPFKAINGMLNTIRNVGVAGVKPFKGLWDKDPISVPEIPKLEEGGILKKGQVGLLEGNGTEAVVPLEKNTQWIDRVAERMKGSVSSDEVMKKLDTLIKAVQEMIKLITGMQVVLDSGALVGEITPKIDEQLGFITSHKGRGN